MFRVLLGSLHLVAWLTGKPISETQRPELEICPAVCLPGPDDPVTCAAALEAAYVCLLYIATRHELGQMGRREACPSGAARQNSCCPDTYFIRRACVLCFLTMLRSRRLFLPRQALNVEAKVVGKTDKRLPNGEAQSCKIVNAFSGHIFTGSSC